MKLPSSSTILLPSHVFPTDLDSSCPSLPHNPLRLRSPRSRPATQAYGVQFHPANRSTHARLSDCSTSGCKRSHPYLRFVSFLEALSRIPVVRWNGMLLKQQQVFQLSPLNSSLWKHLEMKICDRMEVLRQYNSHSGKEILAHFVTEPCTLNETGVRGIRPRQLLPTYQFRIERVSPLQKAYMRDSDSVQSLRSRNLFETSIYANKSSAISTRVAAKLPRNDIQSYRGQCNAARKIESKSDDAQSGTKSDDGSLSKAVRTACCIFAASTAAAMLQFQGTVAPAFADSLTISFPASRIGEISTVQRTLVETWGIVRETYLDPTFNHQDWDSKLQETMSEILPLKTADAAYGKIRSMLATLGDPFTRIVNPEEYQSFRIGSDGALEGVGLLIASDRDTGHLIVLSSIEGSPAAKAGIQSGDELLQIDDEALSGMDGEHAATKLRGHAGTTVKLKLRHPAVGGMPKQPEVTEVNLTRETIVLSPVFTTVLPHVATDGHLIKTGYLRLTAFSQNAAADMETAINKLESEGADSYILDLRNNPGGLVKAGLDVAEMWLDGDGTLVNTIDRDGNTLPVSLVNGHALTHDPLVILVNEGSASASEILAGALHDNGRAVLVGSKTFGKGKIQSVTELNDGSALFVTVAKYLSPALHEIDQVGIAPDVQCTLDKINAPPSSSSGSFKRVFSEPSLVSPIEQDLCIVTAEHQLGLF